MQISIIATATALPGAADTLRTLFTELRDTHVRFEQGCEQYEFFLDGNAFVVIERWADQAALDRHVATPHFADFIPRIKACLEGGAFAAEVITTSERQFITI